MGTEVEKKVALPVEVAAIANLVGSGAFLPRVQYMTSANPEVKNGTFKGLNHFALVEDSALTDLGESVDCLILSVNSLAIDKNGPGGQAIFCYDQKLVNGQPTGLFAEIVAKTALPNSGCFFGPNFLIFIPKIKKYATFLMGSKTARRDSASLVGLYQKSATLKGHLIPNKKFGDYMSPYAIPCDSVFELPDPREAQEIVHQFLNPVVAPVAESATDAEAAAQNVPQ